MMRGAAPSNVFQAIASPTRRALLDTLARGEHNVTDLVATLDVTQSAVSQQLSILKAAGLVAERSDGRFRYYQLRIRPLLEVESWVARYRVHLERSFDALGDVLDAMPTDAPRKPRRRRRAT